MDRPCCWRPTWGSQGGPRQYAATLARHHGVHCLPGSVDAAHFSAEPREHVRQRNPARPRQGYCGVINEQLNLALLAALADARPTWQFVMLGPVVRVNPSQLPRRDSLHWLGPRGYAELPAHLVGWNVCLLPMALEEAARFISPFRTLEYLAARRPCVITRIRDVAELHGAVVDIAEDAAGFVAPCERILNWTPA